MKILSLAFDNFFSFGERQELVFSDSLKRLVGDQRFKVLSNGTSVSLASVILGANGSGKTNALKTISFLAWFARSSARSLDEGEKIPFHHFQFSDISESPTDFAMNFEHKGSIYSYCLTLCSTYSRVLYEDVSKLNFETNRYTYLIKREYDEENDIYTVNKKDINLSVRALKEFLRPNCSLLAASRKMTETGLEDVVNGFGNISVNVNISGRSTNDSGELGEATHFFSTHEKYKSVVEEIIVDLDLGISGLKYKNIEYSSLPEDVIEALKQEFDDFDENEGHFTAVNAIHNVSDKSYELSLVLESGGTKGLFCLLRHIVPALAHGGVAVIDELELGLHPIMVEKLIKLFIEPGSNPNRAQLIATTHSANVLENLDSCQILFVEKDEESLQSEIWRLSDIKGVMKRENFFRGYMSGKYGAIPKV